jgi:hypothetical protein
MIAKLTTDSVPAIDIRQLQRSRELMPGNRIVNTWTRGGLIAVQVEIDIQHNQLRIRYVRVSISALCSAIIRRGCWSGRSRDA